METKRLFVGGLSNDIKEEDLRYISTFYYQLILTFCFASCTSAGPGSITAKKEFIMRTAVVCNLCLQPLITALNILVVYVLDGTLYQTS